MRFCDDAIQANRLERMKRQKCAVEIPLNPAAVISKGVPALGKLLFAKPTGAVVEREVWRFVEGILCASFEQTRAHWQNPKSTPPWP